MTPKNILKMAREADLHCHVKLNENGLVMEDLEHFAGLAYIKGYDAGVEDGCEACIDILKRLHERQGPETAHNYYLYAARVIKARGQP
jgi:hypothetical protein